MKSHCWIFITVIAAICGIVPAADAESIPVANHSFEKPYVPPVDPYAWPVVDDWIELDTDTSGYSQNTGVFVNVTQIANSDANQIAFLGAEAGNAFLQELTADYEVGKSYRMTVGVCVSGAYPPFDPNGLELVFYYTQPGDPNRVDIAKTVTDSPSTFSSLVMEDNRVYVPAVQPTDPWANRPIGIAIRANGPMGGFWDVDNVRVTAYPLVPDFTDDGFVNLADFAVLADEWLFCGDTLTDVTGEGCVNEKDLGILAEYWLDHG